MKRITILLVVISLIIIATIQYLRYARYQMSGEYDYQVQTDIDAAYHDPKLVVQYFETAYRIGSFAREAWINDGIDVKFPDRDHPRSVNATAAYNQMIISVKQLEAKLRKYMQLKKQGFGNEQIKFIEENGISEKQYTQYRLLKNRVLRKGDAGAEVWEFQKLLNSKGYKIPVDGKFADETENVVREFQRKQQQYPSGVADESMLMELLNQP